VDGMSLMWFLKQLAGPKSSGFFAYLISRNQNKSRIELEKARQETATDLIDRLPDGAVYREAQQMDRERSGCRRSTLFDYPSSLPTAASPSTTLVS
jgi:hypothetical protein